MMTYKGYSANIEVDLEAEILFGRVLDINDVVTFKAQTIEEAGQEFQKSIDDYLEFCQELGQEPDKPFILAGQSEEIEFEIQIDGSIEP